MSAMAACSAGLQAFTASSNIVCISDVSSRSGGHFSGTNFLSPFHINPTIYTIAHKHGWRTVSKSGRLVASVSSTVKKFTESKEEFALVEALLGIKGRGRGISAPQLQEVQDAVKALEKLGGAQDPTSSPLIEGRWQLMFTTRPGSASPIQRAFVGVDVVTVFQDICLSNTEYPRVNNIVRFPADIGELNVQVYDCVRCLSHHMKFACSKAAASKGSNTRILFRFDKAAFTFKFIPFKVPYPVPFRLLGDEVKGWLETTYLSPSGLMRISKGNKGTTFVLQKKLEPRQQLLWAISSSNNVEEAIERLIPLNPSKTPTDFDGISGTWRLLWSSQGENANWIQKLSADLSNWQIYSDSERVQNLVEFFPGMKLSASAQTSVISDERQGVKIEGATLELGSLRIPANITGEGYIDILYLDSKLKISRGNKGSMFVHIRDSERP